MNPQLSKKTLFDFFSGHATPFQKKLIEEWLQDPHCQEQYYEWLDEYQREHPQVINNTDEAWQQLLSQMNTAEVPLRAEKPVPPRRPYAWTWVAAAMTVLAVVAFLGRDTVLYKTYATHFGEIRAMQLADGSTVTLNANSSLRIPRFGFGNRIREVFLKGEAEFNVVHTRTHTPFVVRTPDALEVEVLGTEFIVYTREQGSKVILNKGSVQLRSLEDTLRKPLIIKPGEAVTVKRAGTFQLQKNPSADAYGAWKDHRFVFYHTPLSEIADRIEENFGLKVRISDATLAARELTGTYKAANANELLELLSTALDLQVTQQGRQVTLRASD